MLYTAEYFVDDGPTLTERAGNYRGLFQTVQRRVAGEPCKYAYMVIYTEDRVVRYAARWWTGRKTWKQLTQLVGRKYKPMSDSQYRPLI